MTEKKKNAERLIWTILLFTMVALVVFATGCVDETEQGTTGLSLTGTVEHDNYYSMMGYAYSSSMDEYVVHVTARNLGSTVTFDSVQIFYDGGDGQGLSTTVVFMDDNDENREVTLGFGQAEELYSSTNGYTIDVLRHTKTGKVALHVTFIHNAQAIDSFHAVLPCLIYWDDNPPELPLWQETTLKFTRDYDAVMAEVQNK